ncbi:MAG TPA: hypothetical protein PL041_01210 [Melioribacteraceae bacterium]|nr:hypothetical protein [Melioribacteraceae bacterium]
MFKYIFKYFAIFLLVIFTLACDKDSETITQTTHFEAIGTAITDASGALVFKILRGVTTDTLFAPFNARSEAMFIKFYDNNEKIIQPPTDKDKYLGYEIADPTLVKVYQHEGEEGGYEFHLDGLKEGKTTIQFFIMHNGHADYRSGIIPIVVKNIEGTHGEPVSILIKDEETDSLLATVDINGNGNGSINLNNNETTDHMVVYFKDSEGREFQPSIAEHSISIVLDNDALAEVTGLVVNEPYAFKLNGKATGSTKLAVKLKHGSTVAKTFYPINVVIN